MWFQRMSLEEWFDAYQYRTRYDVGESAVKFLKVRDLGIDLSDVDLRYGHHWGRPELRALISEEYPGLSPDDVLVTSGGAEAIFGIVATLARPGDHVIVEHPNYPSTYEVARGLGCEVDLLRLRFEDGFKPDFDRLEAMITPRTRLLIFTHPNNPTGAMISTAELERLVGIAEAHGVYLLFDETYRHLAFADPLPAAASLSARAVSITSMSKCYGLPGIRIGWLATKSRAILEGVLAVREQVTITNTALGEVLAAAALARRDHFLGQAKAHIAANYALVAGWMEAHRDAVEWVPPEGGVVGLPRLTGRPDEDPEALYRSLAEEHGVFVIPGRCFELDNRFFRLGFGATPAELGAGLERLGAALASGAGAAQV